MKIRLCSDLHLEFADYTIPDLPTDQESVLVIAGDVGLAHKPSNLKERYVPFMKRASAQFRDVIVIMGNHEHYGGSFVRTYSVLTTALSEAALSNVRLLEKETVVIEDVAFIGATLWTDCDRHSPHAPYLFSGMNDSRTVRTGPVSMPYERKFSAQASWVDHELAKRFIFNEITERRASGLKTAVVTHHGPTLRSIHERYSGSNMNMFYASELTNEIINANPTIWMHGHTHHQFDYLVDESLVHCQTRVVTNPRGYYGHEDTSAFNETLVIEV